MMSGVINLRSLLSEISILGTHAGIRLRKAGFSAACNTQLPTPHFPISLKEGTLLGLR
jgi:hypothetical protein